MKIMQILETPLGLKTNTGISGHLNQIMTPATMDFIIALHEKFNQQRLQLLHIRKEQSLFTNKSFPVFSTQSEKLAASNWSIDLPSDLSDQQLVFRVPAGNFSFDQIKSLNSKVVLVDFNLCDFNQSMDGHINLSASVRQLTDESQPTLLVKPHTLDQENTEILIHDTPASAALIDFGIHCFNNTYELLRNESNPYFILPEVENQHEARWWKEVLVFAQNYLGLSSGTIKIKAEITTIPSLIEMEEILEELKQYVVGVEFNLRSYLSSHIQSFKGTRRMSLPNMDQVSVNSPFVKSSLDFFIQKAHKRGLPGTIDLHITAYTAFEAYKIKRAAAEVLLYGFDGIVTSSPEEVQSLKHVLSECLLGDNQIENKRYDVSIFSEDLWKIPTGTITEEGLKTLVRATRSETTAADLERLLLNQWLEHGCKTVSGRVVDATYVQELEQSGK